jgi:hypothetical protein
VDDGVDDCEPLLDEAAGWLFDPSKWEKAFFTRAVDASHKLEIFVVDAEVGSLGSEFDDDGEVDDTLKLFGRLVCIRTAM